MKDTLVVMCSGTGFTPEVLEFVHRDLGLGDADYDLFAVPGGVHSLGITAFLPKFRWVTERWVKFLVEEHRIKRIVVLDHDGCIWFKKLAQAEPAIVGKAQARVMSALIERWGSTLPEGTTLEVWHASRLENEVKFEKVK